MNSATKARPHIGFDATADTFAGNEIDPSQVRQFVGLMRKLAIVANGSVVLLAHPSLTGINSGTGLSGSTAWHNSVRARMLLKSPSRDSTDDQSASDLHELSFLKNNYGPLAERIVLRFRNGLFLPEAGQSTLEKLARNQKVDETFLDVLGKLTRQNRPVSPSAHASNYGPKVIADHPDGKAYTQRDYRAARAAAGGKPRQYRQNQPLDRPASGGTSLATGKSRTDGISALHSRRKKYPAPARPSIKPGLSTSASPRNRVIALATCLAR
jgi:RecA-family ATPase